MTGLRNVRKLASEGYAYVDPCLCWAREHVPLFGRALQVVEPFVVPMMNSTGELLELTLDTVDRALERRQLCSDGVQRRPSLVRVAGVHNLADLAQVRMENQSESLTRIMPPSRELVQLLCGAGRFDDLEDWDDETLSVSSSLSWVDSEPRAEHMGRVRQAFRAASAAAMTGQELVLHPTSTCYTVIAFLRELGRLVKMRVIPSIAHGLERALGALQERALLYQKGQLLAPYLYSAVASVKPGYSLKLSNQVSDNSHAD
mmetsp:Transcript_45687/g.99283  ORF Transcript_45687/g.99283 Transcript_45687/m.99283 type:complete len:259 (-) Transcript_45687:94-870(-)